MLENYARGWQGSEVGRGWGGTTETRVEVSRSGQSTGVAGDR